MISPDLPEDQIRAVLDDYIGWCEWHDVDTPFHPERVIAQFLFYVRCERERKRAKQNDQS
jgi:hypothetical protein